MKLRHALLLFPVIFSLLADVIMANGTGDISAGINPPVSKVGFLNSGNIVYVEPGGACGGKSPCYITIQAGIDATAGSGRIMVAQGTYHENIVVNTSKEFSLEAGWDSTFATKTEDPSLTVIDGDATGDGIGDGSVITLEAAEGIFISASIENFTITNGYDTDWERFTSGGGINVLSAGADNLRLTVLNDIITNNTVNDRGGGLYNEDGTVTIVNSSFNENIVISGAGSMGGSGGGIANDGGAVSMTNSTLSGNYGSTGGGVSNEGSGTITIVGSSISSNLADYGGGIESYFGTMTVTNTTIYHNRANVEGGGIVNGWGTLNIMNSTISGNGAQGAGGIENHPAYSGTVTLQNTILANPNFDAERADCYGTITSLGNNIIGDPSGCTITLLTTDQTGDPGLGVYIDNKTPGYGHVEVLPGSPAIDAGNNSACPSTDQLGQPRRDGNLDGAIACDIGAIEFHDPVGTIAINAGNAYTGANSATLNLSCIDAFGNNCAMMRLSNDGINWSATELYAPTGAWTLSDGDGIKMVYARFQDNDGNWSSVITDQIILDAIPPTTPLALTATAVSSSQVILSWTPSTDVVGVVGYYIYRNSSLAGTTDAPVYLDKGLAPSKEYTYSVQAYDIGGHVSQAAAASATTPGDDSLKRYPILNMLIGPTVDGDCSEYQNVPSIQITNGKETGTYRFLWTDYAVYGCATVTDGQLNADIILRDGELYMDDSVELFFDTSHDRGSLRNANDYKFIVNLLNTQFDANYGSPGINWNETWPSAVYYSGTINNDSDTDVGYAIEFSVPITQSAPNGVWGFDLSLNAKDEAGTIQTAWANTTGGEFNDPDGWGEMVFVDASVDDTIPPLGTITINSGDPDTTSRSVTLTLEATDASGVSGMCVSNTASCTNWEAYSTTKPWTLPADDGVKTVYVWFRDNSYQYHSNPIPYSDSIVLTMPPYRLRVTKHGSPADMVQSNPPGISCGPVCSADFEEGTPVTLTASPDPSQMYFDGWTGGCVGNTLVCQLIVGEDTEVTATFDTIADFEASPLTGRAPLLIGFSDTSVNSPSSWFWDFGDGFSSDLQNPGHIFVTAGKYNVTLVATGSGISPQKTKEITVDVCNEGPVRIPGSDFSRIGDACGIASDGEDVLMQAIGFTEDLVIADDTSVTLRGGYDCGFSRTQGLTGLQGSLTVSEQGSVSVENLMIR